MNPRTVAIRRGQSGDAVHDLQHRLLVLAYPIDPDERGAFGESTDRAVRAFQQRRGLIVDGIVGPDTWRNLVETSWRLGDRTLYFRSPHLRGDDVRELQERLVALGFDTGRVDGIFGPQTAGAVRGFQSNYGLPDDAIVGDETVRALRGMRSAGGDTPVTVVREREALRRLPRTLTGMRVVLDPGHGADDPGHVGPAGTREDRFTFALACSLEAALKASGAMVFLTRTAVTSPAHQRRVRLAERVGADLYLALHAGGSADPNACGAAAYYYGHERWHSHAGARLADLILEQVCALGLTDGRTHPKTFAVLRDTRMPAVQLEPGHITNAKEEQLLADPEFVARLADAIATALGRFPAESAIA